MKGLIDKRTRAKFTFLGPNYKAELLKFVDEENLPTIFGGKSELDEHLINCHGPWKENNSQRFQKSNSIETETDRDLNENETQEEEKINQTHKEENQPFKSRTLESFPISNGEEKNQE